MRRLTLVLGSAVVVAAAVGVGIEASRDDIPYADMQACRRPRIAPAPSRTEGEAIPVRFTPVAAIPDAIGMAPLPDGSAAVVVTRTGGVFSVDLASGGTEQHLDIGDRLALGAEGGLLAVAVHPSAPFAYLHYTDRAGTSRIVEFGLDGARLDAESEREVLSLRHPGRLHNGGALRFGPDGSLYLGFGSGGDKPKDAARVEDLGKLDGKLLRIDPRPAAGRPYGIPAGNPHAGDGDARPEIWASGLRNPWQFSFDRATGDLWIGDVGSSCYEEVDVLPAGTAGADFGYPRFEGFHAFLDDEADDSILPVHEYRHGPDGCAVIGGVVYHGTAVPALDGAYLMADYCTEQVRWLRRTKGGGVAIGTLAPTIEGVQSFAEGPDGAVYLLSANDGVLRLEAP
ncbi:MAG: PQQ-dependent sugar dehydrogenase [Actinomycetota bacterium]